MAGGSPRESFYFDMYMFYGWGGLPVKVFILTCICLMAGGLPVKVFILTCICFMAGGVSP